FWKEKRMAWYQSLITQKKKIRFHEHSKDELAHYAKVAFDIEYETPFGWKEWEGIHWRGDWDLSRHSQYSGKDLSYTDPMTGEKFIPWIVETSGGVDRTFLYLLFDAYREEKDKEGIRVVLSLHPKVAPVKVAVFPLLPNKPELVKVAKKIYEDLKNYFNVAWDDIGNIGKRYRRQDEIGTPWCLTIDFDTLKDKTVTVRDRDTMKQERIAIDKLKDFFQTKLL
ncbi:MAG: His/Gly/Thr/Pro-type tRNA ligase C-terminal domain-containing protein, partial [Candidatus Shapirobacteria bacterium]|nr:His/Gly/Thr/Pro-type tRNA ligase C-terminal domain-containing protein [Candidatus Shapirobacteria bacterium]